MRFNELSVTSYTLACQGRPHTAETGALAPGDLQAITLAKLFGIYSDGEINRGGITDLNLILGPVHADENDTTHDDDDDNFLVHNFPRTCADSQLYALSNQPGV